MQLDNWLINSLFETENRIFDTKLNYRDKYMMLHGAIMLFAYACIGCSGAMDTCDAKFKSDNAQKLYENIKRRMDS